MANRLKMAKVNAILTLHRSGHSNRRIAELLQIHRETVARYVARWQAEFQNRPEAPPGCEPAATQNRPEAPPGAEPNEGPFPGGGDASRGLANVAGGTEPNVSRSGRASECEPYRETILAKLEQGLSATRIHQDLREEESFQGSYYSVRRFVARLGQNRPLPFRRIETVAGEEAQVDFGTGAPIVDSEGKRRRPWVLRVVLSHSRKGYSEVVYRQTTDNFIAALENAFVHFGGVPKTLVIDNLKAAVARADWYDPEIHPKLQSFAAHYGTTFLPTKPYTPRHKGKVERGVDYVQENGLKGRTFASLAQQNEHLLDWETRVADTRIHGTTKRQVQRQFEEVERDALLPLPAERFPSFREMRRTVHRDGHVEVDKAYYSTPPEYVGRRLWVRADSRLVRIFNDRWEQIAIHAKAEPGKFRTAAAHIPTKKVSAVERGTDHLLKQVAWLGPNTSQWAQAMIRARGVEGVRVLVGLKSLAGDHDAEAMEHACGAALSHGAYRLRTVRELLKRRTQEVQKQFDFLEEHPIIRPLSDYSLDSLHRFRAERNPR